MAIVRRLNASEGRVPALENRVSTVEQHLFELQAALAELQVVRTQTAQLDASVCDFAPLAAEMAELRKAAGHVQFDPPRSPTTEMLKKARAEEVPTRLELEREAHKR
eukprot:2677893-Pyramimonas_sp.AAC.1